MYCPVGLKRCYVPSLDHLELQFHLEEPEQIGMDLHILKERVKVQGRKYNRPRAIKYHKSIFPPVGMAHRARL